jgi:hypothetical protein
VASLGQIESELGSLPVAIRATFRRIFTILVRDLRFGHPDVTAPTPLENFGGAFVSGTTASTPGVEFSVLHGFGRVPYLVLPCAPLDTVGAQLVPLTVSRVADARRVYFTSTVASAPFTVVLEG